MDAFSGVRVSSVVRNRIIVRLIIYVDADVVQVSGVVHNRVIVTLHKKVNAVEVRVSDVVHNRVIIAPTPQEDAAVGVRDSGIVSKYVVLSLR